MRSLRLLLHILVVVVVALLPMLQATVANAAPASGDTATPTAGGRELPKNFPADLRRFVGGTEEFRPADWFTGTCKDKGGDIGAYAAAVMTEKSRLLYWTADDATKLKFWGLWTAADGGIATPGLDKDDEKKKLETTDEKVLERIYPDSFPNGDSQFQPGSACATDIAGWGSPSTSTWGFDWAKAPDADSLAKMRNQQWADQVPESAWTDACGAQDTYVLLCENAMFLDCDKADVNAFKGDCISWNVRIGKLFGGIMNWIDQNQDWVDKIQNSKMAAVAGYTASGIANAFAWVWNAAGEVVAFIKDPTNVIDDWANSAKSSALSTTSAVLHGLANTGEFDVTDAGFLRWYATSMGLGIFAMCIMSILAIRKAGAGKIAPAQLVEDLFVYMPTGLMVAMFAPAFAQLLITFAHELTLSLNSMLGQDVDDAVNNISAMLGAITDKQFAGGALAALLGFGLIFLGALSLFFGLLVHQAALPVLALVSAIGFGMWVHPTWRRKALRPVLIFIGIVFSKPLLFICIGGITTVLNSAAADSVGADGDLGSLTHVALVAVCMAIIGLGPWSLLKWGPILPTSADSDDFGSGGGSATGTVLGSSAGMFQMAASSPGSAGGHNQQAAAAPSRGSGSGGGGGGGGGGRAGAGSSAETSSASSVHASGSTNRGSASGHAATGRSGITKSSSGGSHSAASSAGGKMAGGLVIPIAAASASAAMSKASSSVQNAPDRADNDGDSS